MERIRSVITRQTLILLGVLFIALAILATTYLALQRQEIRKIAEAGDSFILAVNPGSLTVPGNVIVSATATVPGQVLNKVVVSVSKLDAQGNPIQWSEVKTQSCLGLAQGNPCTASETQHYQTTDVGSWMYIMDVWYDQYDCTTDPCTYIQTALWCTSNPNAPSSDTQCGGASRQTFFANPPDTPTPTGPTPTPTPTRTPSSACFEQFGCQTLDATYHQCDGDKHINCISDGTTYKPTDLVYVERWTNCDDGGLHFYTELVESNSPTCIPTPTPTPSATCPGPFTGSGSNGNSGSTCLANYSFNATSGNSYTISTCDSFTGDPYLVVSGACSCSNDDSCGLGSACTCTATSTGSVNICASTFDGTSASWSYTITSTSCPNLTTPTPTPIPDTCTPADCSPAICTGGATCSQNPSSPTKSCSCRFPPTPTPTPSSAPTPTPGGTVLALSLNLEGLPAVPLRTTEPVGVTLKSSDGTTLGPFVGMLTYASTPTGHFKGLVPLGATVSSGTYQVLIKPRSYLARNFAGIAITQNTTTTIPFDPSPTKLFLSCDIGPNDVVDMLDVGQVITDFGKQGTGAQASFADINRNWFGDIFDHNYCVQNFGKGGEVFQ